MAKATPAPSGSSSKETTPAKDTNAARETKDGPAGRDRDRASTKPGAGRDSARGGNRDGGRGGPRPQPGGTESGGSYIAGVVSELRKVTWPTGKDLVRMTQVVIATVIIFALMIGGLDALLGFFAKPLYTQPGTSSPSTSLPVPTLKPSAKPSASASPGATVSPGATTSGSGSASVTSSASVSAPTPTP